MSYHIHWNFDIHYTKANEDAVIEALQDLEDEVEGLDFEKYSDILTVSGSASGIGSSDFNKHLEALVTKYDLTMRLQGVGEDGEVWLTYHGKGAEEWEWANRLLEIGTSDSIPTETILRTALDWQKPEIRGQIYLVVALLQKIGEKQ